ncbi:MAG: DUF3592 domain-containing protein [Flammeovirgaceae bacterium]|nr:DUF3592 domain-containing protein [Flammeovirgaceae bacterium]
MSVFIMIFALGLLSSFFFAYYLIENEKGDLVPIEATVIDIQPGTNSKEHLVTEYDWNEITYIDTIDYATESGKYPIGETVEVLIHPAHPTPAVLEEELHIGFLETLESADETGEIGDLQGLQWILDGITYFTLWPGLFFFFLSIFLWWLGGKIGGK